MPGRLKANWSEWAKLRPNRFVTSVINHGYRLQWENGIPPPRIRRPNGKEAYKNEKFVTDKIEEVLQGGIVRECREEDLHCIFGINTIPKPNSTKKRFILDGSPLKKYEKRRKFKLEQLTRQGREIFAGCSFGSVIDILNG
jgi:hypothetical protein